MLENLEGKGIFAYVLAETLEELQDLHHQINDLLSQAKIKTRLLLLFPIINPLEISVKTC